MRFFAQFNGQKFLNVATHSLMIGDAFIKYYHGGASKEEKIVCRKKRSLAFKIWLQWEKEKSQKKECNSLKQIIIYVKNST